MSTCVLSAAVVVCLAHRASNVYAYERCMLTMLTSIKVYAYDAYELTARTHTRAAGVLAFRPAPEETLNGHLAIACIKNREQKQY